ncbi:Trehalose-phosphate phosphatase [bacterium HR23]|nr:Trehalose-phosphate phosphatase [bacterium HR23]
MAPPQVLSLLEALAGVGYRVVVISGRSRKSLEQVLGRPQGCTLVYLHGWEILWDGELVRPWGEPDPLPSGLLSSLSTLSIPGVVVEHKGPSIALHYRLVEHARKEEARRAFLDALAGYQPQGYEILEGKEVVEVRPQGASKGSAVAWIAERLARHSPLRLAVFGDDTADLDMFRAVGKRGLTVAVGEPPLPLARWWLRSPQEVHQALGLLLHGMMGPRGHNTPIP